MNKKIEWYELIFLALFGIVMIVLIVTSGGADLDTNNYIQLNEGWTVTHNEKELLFDYLKDSSMGLANKGDVVYMETILPQYDIESPDLELFSVHSVVDVYLDGELIYTYGHELNDAGKVLGYGYHYIPLPKGDKKRKLCIELHVTEDDAFSTVDVPRICNGKNVRKDYLRANGVGLVVTNFLITLGIVLLMATLFIAFAKKKFLKLFSVAMFSLSIGLWAFANFNLLFIFTDNLVTKVYLEFSGLQLATLFMLVYFRDDNTGGSKLRRIIYTILELSTSALILVSFIGQATGLVHFPATLKLLHIHMVVIVAFIFGNVISDMIHKKASNIVLLGGIIIVLFFIVFDLLRFYVEKYIPAFAKAGFKGFGCIGALIFVLSMIVNLMNQVSVSMYRQAEEKTLMRLAYIDPLTNIANRRACEEEMDKIDKNNSEYGIIEFDLNNLKDINDSLGHEEGDKYLQAFSQALTKVFENAKLVSRIGGDEFVVIYENTQSMNVKEDIIKLQKELEELNKENEGWNMSTAYGASTYKENGGCTIRKGLKLADARMYENKAKMK
ncbi:MAG: GGDEF domain-containing protein [Lachnospiraceae bacterium]|nr:GGDEF domain-containing protein [Lachnospiraceae bacterium]